MASEFNSLKSNAIKKKNMQHVCQSENFDYSPRGQWLRAAVLGANDGLVCVASLMMGVGDMKDGFRAMILLGFSSLVAGACSIVVQEYVSVYSQLDIELAQMKRVNRSMRNQEEQERKQMPNPMRAAIAASSVFSVGGIVPLLVACFVRDCEVRLGMVLAAVCFTLVIFGWIWSILGGTPVAKSCFRVLLGGLIALAITYGRATLIGSGRV